MTTAHTPGPDRMYGFIVTGMYTSEKRITSPELSRAVGSAVSAQFGDPDTIMSYIMPRMSSPLVYDLRTVWTNMSEDERAAVYTFNGRLFNAITMLLKAVPERATDDSTDETGESGSTTGVQAISEQIKP